MEKNKKVKGITSSIKGTKIRGRIQKKKTRNETKSLAKKKEKKRKEIGEMHEWIKR